MDGLMDGLTHALTDICLGVFETDRQTERHGQDRHMK